MLENDTERLFINDAGRLVAMPGGGTPDPGDSNTSFGSPNAAMICCRVSFWSAPNGMRLEPTRNDNSFAKSHWNLTVWTRPRPEAEKKTPAIPTWPPRLHGSFHNFSHHFVPPCHNVETSHWDF